MYDGRFVLKRKRKTDLYFVRNSFSSGRGSKRASRAVWKTHLPPWCSMFIVRIIILDPLVDFPNLKQQKHAKKMEKCWEKNQHTNMKTTMQRSWCRELMAQQLVHAFGVA